MLTLALLAAAIYWAARFIHWSLERDWRRSMLERDRLRCRVVAIDPRIDRDWTAEEILRNEA